MLLSFQSRSRGAGSAGARVLHHACFPQGGLLCPGHVSFLLLHLCVRPLLSQPGFPGLRAVRAARPPHRLLLLSSSSFFFVVFVFVSVRVAAALLPDGVLAGSPGRVLRLRAVPSPRDLLLRRGFPVGSGAVLPRRRRRLPLLPGLSSATATHAPADDYYDDEDVATDADADAAAAACSGSP